MTLRHLATGQFTNLGGSVTADGFSDEVAVIQAGGSVAHYVTAQLVVEAGGEDTLDTTIEGSFDQTNWFTLATFTQVTTSAAAEVETVTAGVVPPYLRANYNVSGATPSYSFDLWLAVS